MGEGLGDGHPLASVLDHEFEDEVLGQIGDGIPGRIVKVPVGSGDVGQGLLVGLAQEGGEPREQHVRDHPARPHVRRERHRLVGDHLGRHECVSAR